jgi:hypothetical protein
MGFLDLKGTPTPWCRPLTTTGVLLFAAAGFALAIAIDAVE